MGQIECIVSAPTFQCVKKLIKNIYIIFVPLFYIVHKNTQKVNYFD